MSPGRFSSLRRRSLLRLIALLTLAANPGFTAPTPPQVDELFAGELDDVGPQYLLLANARPPPLELWSDLEITGTSNATLVETNPKASTITSAQAGGTWHFSARPRWHGQLALETGFRLQTFRYGLLAGPKQKINFLEIDRNDFDLVGAHVAANWRRDGWFASTALRGASFRNRAADRVFYQEISAEWQVFRQWHLGPRMTLTAGGEGALRWSHTDSYGLLAPGLNNRLEQAFVAVLDRALTDTWRVQPALRVQGTRYTHRDRHRDDVHASGRLSLIRAIGGGELRLGLGYDRRESSEAETFDFKKWDLNLGGRMQWQF
jgi:hypothetical protein